MYLFGKKFLILLNTGGSIWSILFCGYATLYFLSLILFSILDARSRYQNYKMTKDRLFIYGFDVRLLKPFLYSRCQRDAISVATMDLDLTKEWEKLTCEIGFRWYHLLPDMVVKNPRMLFSKDYWKKTLFVRSYKSKYFLW
jgi:hypothetical protein